MSSTHSSTGGSEQGPSWGQSASGSVGQQTGVSGSSSAGGTSGTAPGGVPGDARADGSATASGGGDSAPAEPGEDRSEPTPLELGHGRKLSAEAVEGDVAGAGRGDGLGASSATVVSGGAGTGQGGASGTVELGPDTGSKRAAERGRLSPSEWEKVMHKHGEARKRLSNREKRVVDEYYRLLRDVR